MIVFEAEDQVGGIAKTEVRDGYRFDLGGHRFFTKSQEVNDLWHEVMKEEFLKRPRQSRIFWNGKFLKYPLDGMDVVRQLGPVELVRSGLSYLWAALKPKGKEENLEQWVSNRFGKRLYQHFFKTYTEKVWGVPTTELRAEWAAQRIKGLSFMSAAKAAFFGNKGNKIKSLIEEFHYPRFGPGQMWETMADEIIANGGEMRMNCRVEKLEIRDGRVVAIEAGGERIEPSHVISSLPLRATVGMAGAAALRRRPGRRPGPALPRLPHHRADHRRRGPVPGHVDLHPRPVRARRPDPELPRLEPVDGPGRRPRPASAWSTSASRATTSGRWTTRRSSSSAGRSSRSSAWSTRRRSSKGYVTRVPLAYPMYDPEYGERVEAVRGWLETIGNLQQVGRNGLHRYNNSDHSMLTAMRAVENLLDGTDHDIWAVNAESVYHETHAQDEHPYRNAPETKAMREPLVGIPRSPTLESEIASSGRLSDGTDAMSVPVIVNRLEGVSGPGLRARTSRMRARKDSLKGGGATGGSRHRPSPLTDAAARAAGSSACGA